ncbi:MAG: hypothetical protein NTV34_15495 [Proteobacteria bacterium]|nr:hypothetical protein [Pseudomonadota bacterium]
MRYSIRVLIFWVLAIILGVFIAQSKLGKPTQVSGIEIGNSEGKTLVGGPSDWIAIVGTESIVPDDINWEIELHTVLPKIDAGDGPPPKAANPELNKSDIAETAKNSDALRQRLLVAHIERKILYQWIKSYSDGFDHDNPVRYISCLSDVKEISEQVPEFFSGPLSKARLKSRLCELSLIDQYLHERILTSSIIPEIDVRNYYLLPP